MGIIVESKQYLHKYVGPKTLDLVISMSTPWHITRRGHGIRNAFPQAPNGLGLAVYDPKLTIS